MLIHGKTEPEEGAKSACSELFQFLRELTNGHQRSNEGVAAEEVLANYFGDSVAQIIKLFHVGRLRRAFHGRGLLSCRS